MFQRLQFSEMSINEMQSGVDDSQDGLSDHFESERIKLTKKGDLMSLHVSTASLRNSQAMCT